MKDYTIQSIPPSDMWAALTCEADRAEREGFPNVAKRQRALATHMRNAQDAMVALCPEGYRVDMNIVFTITPNVNPVARRD